MTSPLRLVLFHRPNSRWRRFRQGRLFNYSSMHDLLSPAGHTQSGFEGGSAQLASASPENVQCRSVFIQLWRALVSLACASVQPVFDSRLGRIACKMFSAVSLHWLVERDRLQSTQKVLHQPLYLADGLAPKFKFSFFGGCFPKHPFGIVIGCLRHHMPGRLG
jgi:hypothetical protein